jgi:hypothetical protein
MNGTYDRGFFLITLCTLFSFTTNTYTHFPFIAFDLNFPSFSTKPTFDLKLITQMSPLPETKNMSRVRADEAARLKMQDSLRAAAEAMETPNDTMLRLFNGVSSCCH